MAALILIAALRRVRAARRAKEEDKRGFVWDDRPSIVFGEDINIDLKRSRAARVARVRSRHRRGHLSTCAPLRIGLKGELTKHFDWEIEREIDQRRRRARSSSATGKTSTWSGRRSTRCRIKGGRFKMPFGLEQNTGVSDLDFAYRALGSTAIAPGRDRGVMVFGDLGRVNYEVGVFDDDGDNAESNEPQFVARRRGSRRRSDRRSPAASPAICSALLPVSRRLRSANFGIAYTNSYVPEGLNSLRGEAVWGDELLRARLRERPPPAHRRAVRLDAGSDRPARPSGCSRASSATSRATATRTSRTSSATAWYVSGHLVRDRRRQGQQHQRAKRPLFSGGIGAIELAVRYEELGFGSASKTGHGVHQSARRSPGAELRQRSGRSA